MTAESQPLAFSKRTCVPCEGGVPTMGRDEVIKHLAKMPEWALDDAANSISRKINAGNFMAAVDLVNQIAQLAEAEQHHPDLHLTGYRHLTIVLTTHAIGGLSENDLIVAAKIDELLS